MAVAAIGITATAELLVELVEYAVLYADESPPGAYYDTVADMAATLVGAVAGAAIGLVGLRRAA